jgi:hypothetical protein
MLTSLSVLFLLLLNNYLVSSFQHSLYLCISIPQRAAASFELIHLVSRSFLSTPSPRLLLIAYSDVEVTNISFAQDLTVTGFLGLLEMFDHLRKDGSMNSINTEIGNLLVTETQNPNAVFD